MGNVAFKPNASSVHARVLNTRRADDGWGAWARVEVVDAATADGSEYFRNLPGKSLEVFVPPPLVEEIERCSTFDGVLTYRGGPSGGVYALQTKAK